MWLRANGGATQRWRWRHVIWNGGSLGHCRRTYQVALRLLLGLNGHSCLPMPDVRERQLSYGSAEQYVPKRDDRGLLVNARLQQVSGQPISHK